MSNKSRIKGIVSVALAVLACATAILFLFRDRIFPEKENIPEDSNGRSGTDSSYDGSTAESGLPYEDDEVSTEQITPESLPYSFYFRKLTFVLKDCVVSKSITGQPAPVFVPYSDLETNENGDILNDYTYFHVTFSLKNESQEDIFLNVNSSRLIIGRISDNIAVDIAEMCMMNRKSESQEQREYYHWTFKPGIEEEFIVTFILRDAYLSDDYTLNYFYSPFGKTDTIKVEGKYVSVSDAKILHLNNLIRREGEGHRNEGASQTSSSSSSEPFVESSSPETISFWQGEEVQVSYETVQCDSGKEFTSAVFEEPVYLPSFSSLKEFSARYGLENRFPLFDLCSPFDGSEPKYIKIDDRISYYFQIPDYEDSDLVISWSWGETTDWTNEAILKEYETFSNIPALKGDTELFQGNTAVVCHHQRIKNGGESDSYTLVWAYQRAYLFIEQMPEEIHENQPELFDRIIQSIQETSYVVK